MQPSLLRVHGFGVDFYWPDGACQFEKLDFTLSSGRCGLVGPNGSGKTTLLELIAGLRKPSSGSVVTEGQPFYLRQALFREAGGTLGDALGVSAKLAALHRLEKGDASQELFETIGDDWNVAERATEALSRAGLPSEWVFSRPLLSLSQGELVRAHLARVLLAPPDILLLDEPSNHLDLKARSALHELIKGFGGICLVTSHDRELLRLMDTVWELKAGRLRAYGGNYDFYRETRDLEERAARQRLEHARNELDRREAEAKDSERRQMKRIERGRREGLAGGMPRILRGALKRNAQNTLAKTQETHEARVRQAKEAKSLARESAQEDARLKIDFAGPSESAGKNVLEAREFNVWLPGSPRPLWSDSLSFTLRRGARIAIEGENGSGKTTFARCILRKAAGEDEPFPSIGTLRVGTAAGCARVAMLDQTVSVLEADATLLELFTELTPSLEESERRVILARFLFPGDRVHAKLGALSGGERMRAGLACALMAEPAPSLLILDEPTNNLDLPAVEQVEAALKDISCALLVISHDEAFLEAIGASERIRLTKNGAGADGV